jgi:hypothetical protein
MSFFNIIADSLQLQTLILKHQIPGILTCKKNVVCWGKYELEVVSNGDFEVKISMRTINILINFLSYIPQQPVTLRIEDAEGRWHIRITETIIQNDWA